MSEPVTDYPVLAFVGPPGAGVTTACVILKDELAYPRDRIIDAGKDIELQSPNDFEWFVTSYLTGLVVAIDAPRPARHIRLQRRDGLHRTPTYQQFINDDVTMSHRWTSRPLDQPNLMWLRQRAAALIYNTDDVSSFAALLARFVGDIRRGQPFGHTLGDRQTYGRLVPRRDTDITSRLVTYQRAKPLTHLPQVGRVESDDPEVDGQPFL